jgi:hypothetical protein
VAAQDAPPKVAPVDARGKEAVTRTRSKPSTAGKPVEAPVARSPERSEPLRAVPAAQPAPAEGERRDPAAPVPSASGAPDAPATVPGRPAPAPPPVRK